MKGKKEKKDKERSWASISEAFVDSANIYKPSEIYDSDPVSFQYLYMILGIPEYFIRSVTLVLESKNSLNIRLESECGKMIEHNFIFNNIEEINRETIFLMNNKRELSINDENYSVYEMLTTPDLLIEADLLYIGQGMKNSALERLRKHSRLQQILADNNEKNPRKDIWIVTFSINEKKYLETMTPIEFSNNKFSDIDDYVSTENLVNITEASLINYFKPIYNIEFTKNTVPSPNHDSYAEYYKKNFNSMNFNLTLLSKFILKTEETTFYPGMQIISNAIVGDMNTFDLLSNYTNTIKKSVED
ncbi:MULTISPECIES: hypothetical protein [Enterococcus]|uniref:hypothetical protein n=1 Tax=Enterococcus TaxID=1350 RepID=UPI000BAFB81C|nr:hypothetical protein [Enterococcus thailandicus]ASZ07107.1 hypothetical protein CK496_04020 [Enterococcus thailandicus]